MTWDELEGKEIPQEKPEVREEEQAPAPKESPTERYLFHHPELYDDFEDFVYLDGESHKRVCRNGIISVYSPKIRDYLKTKGFIYLRSEKIS
jgi:hypothetical protein